MDDGMSKREFIEILCSERERWETCLGDVGEAQMIQPGVAGDWSVKDIVAHVTAYERGLVEWLEAALRGELLELPDLDHPDVDRRNAAIFLQNQGRPLVEVLRESKQVFERLLELVRGLSEAELTEPERTDWFVRSRWNESRPLWKCIADDSYKHYHQHIPDIRAWLDRDQE
jgi:hypothetical protein